MVFLCCASVVIQEFPVGSSASGITVGSQFMGSCRKSLDVLVQGGAAQKQSLSLSSLPLCTQAFPVCGLPAATGHLFQGQTAFGLLPSQASRSLERRSLQASGDVWVAQSRSCVLKREDLWLVLSTLLLFLWMKREQLLLAELWLSLLLLIVLRPAFSLSVCSLYQSVVRTLLTKSFSTETLSFLCLMFLFSRVQGYQYLCCFLTLTRWAQFLITRCSCPSVCRRPAQVRCAVYGLRRTFSGSYRMFSTVKINKLKFFSLNCVLLCRIWTKWVAADVQFPPCFALDFMSYKCWNEELFYVFLHKVSIWLLSLSSHITVKCLPIQKQTVFLDTLINVYVCPSQERCCCRGKESDGV